MNLNVITTPSRAPTTVDYGPVALITGSDTFSLAKGTVREDPNGTKHGRGGFTSTLTCDDERVAGKEVATWNTTGWPEALIFPGTPPPS